MRIPTLKPYLFHSVTFLGILITLTPFYTLGIIIGIATLAVKFPLMANGFFRPLSTRLITTFLIFSAWVMLIGSYSWISGVKLTAFVSLVLFTFTYWIIYYKVSREVKIEKTENNTTTIASSALSGILAFAGIGIMIASFYLPSPQLTSSIQIITNGYDNTAHLSLISTTYNNNGYLYGSYNDIKANIGWKTLTAYPQGWHFATSFIWKGFNLPLFTKFSAPLDINMYITTMFLWYFMALFLLLQLIWYVLKRLNIINRLTFTDIVSFSALSFLLQLLVFWGSLTYGFVTFICALAYLFLLAGILIHANEYTFKKNSTYLYLLFGLALLATMAITQGWLFALPIATFSVVAGFLPVIKNSFKQYREVKKPLTITFLSSMILGIPIIIQIMVNKLYSTQGGNQINDDGGIFAINTLLALVVIIIACVTMLSTKFIGSNRLRLTIMAVTLPALLLCVVLYDYQLLTLGHTAYFFTKCLALTLCLLWIPLSVFVFTYIKDLSRYTPKIVLITIVFVALTAVPLMLGQDLSSINKLLQRNSNITTEDAQKIAHLAEDGSLKKKSTLVLTQGSYDGDAIGSIFTTMQGVSSRDRCIGEAMWTIVTRRNNELPHYLNMCTSQSKDIQVITSERTDPNVLHSLNTSIDIINK